MKSSYNADEVINFNFSNFFFTLHIFPHMLMLKFSLQGRKEFESSEIEKNYEEKLFKLVKVSE